MFRDRTVAVVVPAYDEAGFVGDVLASMPASVDRIYPVDDASTDGTWAELRAVAHGDATSPADGAADPLGSGGEFTRALAARVCESAGAGRVLALRHGRNRGAGGAVKTGYLAALAAGADLVATIDGDGQMDPALLDRFLRPLVDGSAAYATGSRFERRSDTREMPAFRRAGNVLLTHLARVATGYRDLSDPVNGYTAITRRALRDIDVPTLYEGYGYGIDVLARLHAAGYGVVDVPRPSSYGAETSSIRYSTYVPRVSRLLAATAVDRLRREQRAPGVVTGPWPDPDRGDEEGRESA
jgi:glycosyltransferase involved in cell wall biosynthesis